MDVALYRLSIPFAILTGSVAGLLAALSWKALRDSPFGLALKLFAVVMSIGTVYHGGLLVAGAETVILQSLLLVGYGLVVVAVVVAVAELTAVDGLREPFGHRNVLLATGAGVLLYVVGGPLSEVFLPELLHWVHGVAALFAIAGLYSPIHDGLQNGPWDDLLPADAGDARQPAEWMTPIDRAILEVLSSSGLVLTPAVIAYNIDYSRAEVNRRLTKLETEGLVERVERGKYRLTENGERYTQG